jgi:hypothetical protein
MEATEAVEVAEVCPSVEVACPLAVEVPPLAMEVEEVVEAFPSVCPTLPSPTLPSPTLPTSSEVPHPELEDSTEEEEPPVASPCPTSSRRSPRPSRPSRLRALLRLLLSLPPLSLLARSQGPSMPTARPLPRRPALEV